MHKLCTLAVATAMVLAAHGATAQCCGDCDGDGEVTVDEILISINRALGGCEEDGICAGQGRTRLLATGQTESYGPGSDGDVQAGIPMAYRDNGDGTITDLNTGLMWEKKSNDGSIYDKDNEYRWCRNEDFDFNCDTARGDPMDGTMVTEFLATLNTAPCFAGYCDWRIPNIRELESIVDRSRSGPLVDPVFHNNCTLGTVGCTVTECSCTAFDDYWSSTTAHVSFGASIVYFHNGYVFSGRKSNFNYVRAVRSGL